MSWCCCSITQTFCTKVGHHGSLMFLSQTSDWESHEFKVNVFVFCVFWFHCIKLVNSVGKKSITELLKIRVASFCFHLCRPLRSSDGYQAGIPGWSRVRMGAMNMARLPTVGDEQVDRRHLPPGSGLALRKLLHIDIFVFDGWLSFSFHVRRRRCEKTRYILNFFCIFFLPHLFCF